MQEAPKADGVVMLALDLNDSTSQVNSFIASNGYTVPVLVDAGEATAITYGVSGIPATFFIGRDGNIKYIKLGMFLSLAELQVDLDKIA